MVRRLLERILCSVVAEVVDGEKGFLVSLSFPWVVLVCLGKRQVVSVPDVAALREFGFQKLVPQCSGVSRAVVVWLGVVLPETLLLL